jgi:SAM-dependent methyltransferase
LLIFEGMKTWLSLGDLIDLQIKFWQKRHLFRRVFSGKTQKTSAYWDQAELSPSNWWNIPLVRQRWKEKVSGHGDTDYPEYVRQKYLEGKKGLRMLSPGCGTGSHELHFTGFEEIAHIDALDISQESIALARKKAGEKINYFVADFHFWLEQAVKKGKKYDLVLFHSSLHHFSGLSSLLPLVESLLAKDGLLLIHEYVGPDRMMWTREQMKEADRLLKSLPDKYRTRWRSERTKKKHYRPGLIRTLLTDPSESVESGSILPLLHKSFRVVEEKPLGGNILHLLLKDISHHFSGQDPRAEEQLLRLFTEEDRFLKSRPSDFMFGIYASSEV